MRACDLIGAGLLAGVMFVVGFAAAVWAIVKVNGS